MVSLDSEEKYKCIRLPQIERDLKLLRKKSRSVDIDLVFAERLLRSGYSFPQTVQYPGFGESHAIFKTRVVNTSSDRGKSGGYRLIYEEILKDSDITFVLILLYNKSTISDENSVRAEVKARIRNPEYQGLQ